MDHVRTAHYSDYCTETKHLSETAKKSTAENVI